MLYTYDDSMNGQDEDRMQVTTDIWPPPALRGQGALSQKEVYIRFFLGMG